jgi:hypothetical protein
VVHVGIGVVPVKAQEPKRDEPVVDLKVVTGALLDHAKFGRGKVISIVDGKMLVKFEVGEKYFQYPGGILAGFLKIV